MSRLSRQYVAPQFCSRCSYCESCADANASNGNTAKIKVEQKACPNCGICPFCLAQVLHNDPDVTIDEKHILSYNQICKTCQICSQCAREFPHYPQQRFTIKELCWVCSRNNRNRESLSCYSYLKSNFDLSKLDGGNMRRRERFWHTDLSVLLPGGMCESYTKCTVNYRCENDCHVLKRYPCVVEEKDNKRWLIPRKDNKIFPICPVTQQDMKLDRFRQAFDYDDKPENMPQMLPVDKRVFNAPNALDFLKGVKGGEQNPVYESRGRNRSKKKTGFWSGSNRRSRRRGIDGNCRDRNL